MIRVNQNARHARGDHPFSPSADSPLYWWRPHGFHRGRDPVISDPRESYKFGGLAIWQSASTSSNRHFDQQGEFPLLLLRTMCLTCVRNSSPCSVTRRRSLVAVSAYTNTGRLCGRVSGRWPKSPTSGIFFPAEADMTDGVAAALLGSAASSRPSLGTFPLGVAPYNPLRSVRRGHLGAS